MLKYYQQIIQVGVAGRLLSCECTVCELAGRMDGRTATGLPGAVRAQPVARDAEPVGALGTTRSCLLRHGPESPPATFIYPRGGKFLVPMQEKCREMKLPIKVMVGAVDRHRLPAYTVTGFHSFGACQIPPGRPSPRPFVHSTESLHTTPCCEGSRCTTAKPPRLAL